VEKAFFQNSLPLAVMGGLLSYFRGLFGSREMRILILGLDGAGKTTLLYRLQVSRQLDGPSNEPVIGRLAKW